MNLAANYILGLDIIGEDSLADDGVTVRVARGDAFLDDGMALDSELPDVSDEEWTQFVRGMATEPLASVSPYNALGMFALTPRRLTDLGLLTKLKRVRTPAGKMVWAAMFTPPMSADTFLRDPEAQYVASAGSCQEYDAGMRHGTLEREPSMSRSGALAILHRAGPAGLKTWAEGKRFPSTEAAYDSVAGIF